MDLGDKALWQVAAGDTDRSYHDLCLRWDVMLFGPGYRGPWPECKPGLNEDKWTTKKINLIRKFCEGIAEGDLIVLRLGTAEVYGVGRVVGDYQWYDDFGDVDGWHLQFVRRVRWLWRYDSSGARNAEPKRFPTYSLKFGDTIQSLDPSSGDTNDILDALKSGLRQPLDGMGTAFSSSLFGLAGSLVLGFLDLQSGQAQNRFYTELENWLSTVTNVHGDLGSVANFGDDSDMTTALRQLSSSVQDGGTHSSQRATAAMANLAEGIQGLVKHMRSEQQLLRDWVESQSAQQKDIKKLLQNLNDIVDRNK